MRLSGWLKWWKPSRSLRRHRGVQGTCANRGCPCGASAPSVSQALQPLHSLAANWWIASYSALAIADRTRMGAESPVALEPATALEANLQEQDDEQNLPAGVGIHAFPEELGQAPFCTGCSSGPAMRASAMLPATSKPYTTPWRGAATCAAGSVGSTRCRLG